MTRETKALNCLASIARLAARPRGGTRFTEVELAVETLRELFGLDDQMPPPEVVGHAHSVLAAALAAREASEE